MGISLKSIANSASKKFNITVISHSRYGKLKEFSKSHRDLTLLKNYKPEIAIQMLNNFDLSNSQIRQDLFALAECGFKREGYFLEFGATNGIDLSNTNMLEKQFGWSGILAEPGKNWHQELKKTGRQLLIQDVYGRNLISSWSLSNVPVLSYQLSHF